MYDEAGQKAAYLIRCDQEMRTAPPGVEMKVHPTHCILVSSDGRVFAPRRYASQARWTTGTVATNGYRAVVAWKQRLSVHHLVVEAFLGPIPKGKEVDHVDRDPGNNALTNLRVCTHKENMRNTIHWDRCAARVGVHQSEDRREYSRLQRQLRVATEEGHAVYLANSRRQDAKRRQFYKRVVIAGNKVRWILKERVSILEQVPKQFRTEEMVQAARNGDIGKLQLLARAYV